MDEIARLKIKVSYNVCSAVTLTTVQVDEHESTIVTKDKELLYLKRSLESVYSRFRSRQESREAEVDAQFIATRTIEELTQKDDEISQLRAQMEDLRNKLAAKPKVVTERDYKPRAKPPAPPPKPQRAVTLPEEMVAAAAGGEESNKNDLLSVPEFLSSSATPPLVPPPPPP